MAAHHSSQVRDPTASYSTRIVADSCRLQQTHGRCKRCSTSTPNSGASSRGLTAGCSSLYKYRCSPALLIGINAFSKPVHIVKNLTEEASPLCVSSETSPLLHELLTGTVSRQAPHYYVDVCTNERDPTQLQVEPANTASSSSAVVHEAAHACTQTSTSSDEDAGGGTDCINIVTLHNVWRLTATDSGDTDSTDDLFMIPIEESLIGQQSSSHELVIDYTYAHYT